MSNHAEQALAYAAFKNEPGASIADYGMGFVIDRDGTVYTLMRRYYHGVVAACLYPEILAKYLESDKLKEEAFDLEDEKATLQLDNHENWNVYAFQRFQFAMSDELPVVFLTEPSILDVRIGIDFPLGPCTLSQVTSLKRLLQDCKGMEQRDGVLTTLIPVTVKTALEMAKLNRDGRLNYRGSLPDVDDGEW